MVDLRTQPVQHGRVCVVIRRARDAALVKYMAGAEHVRDFQGRGESASVVSLA